MECKKHPMGSYYPVRRTEIHLTDQMHNLICKAFFRCFFKNQCSKLPIQTKINPLKTAKQPAGFPRRLFSIKLFGNAPYPAVLAVV